MNNAAEGLVYAHRLGTGKSESLLTWADVEAWQPDNGLLWIHLDASNEKSLNWLEHHGELSSLIREALLELVRGALEERGDGR